MSERLYQCRQCLRWSARRQFCLSCRRERDRALRRRRDATGPPRPSMSERGYGREHFKLRAQWTPLVDAGAVRCARCGDLIVPGTPWDLGHDDHDRSRYVGPEHAACNRATSGRRNQRRRASRVW